MKSGTLDLMKFKRLKRLLGESERGTAGLLECLWQRSWKDCPRGDIGRLTNEEIAVIADWQGDADTLVAALVETGWLDVSDVHRLVIHDWHDHAPYWLKGVVSRKGGFATIEASYSPQLMSPTIEANTQVLPSLPSPSLTKPNPPLPSQSAPDPEPLGAVWQEVVEVLTAEGMGGAEQACEECRGRGCHAGEAMRAIEHWQKNKPRWGIGLLYRRLQYMRPGESHLRGWPEGGVVAYEEITAEEFAEHGRQKRFKKKPERHRENDSWVFGELRDGRKVECRNYPKPTPKAATLVSEDQSC